MLVVGELREAPGKAIVFIEDLSDTKPAVYIKSKFQTALQLRTHRPTRQQNPGARLTASERHAFAPRSTATFALLRQLVQQVAEHSQHRPGFAHQDADMQIVYFGVLSCPSATLAGSQSTQTASLGPDELAILSSECIADCANWMRLADQL